MSLAFAHTYVPVFDLSKKPPKSMKSRRKGPRKLVTGVQLLAPEEEEKKKGINAIVSQARLTDQIKFHFEIGAVGLGRKQRSTF